jgi:two-component system, NarL family, response regulator EvgA
MKTILFVDDSRNIRRYCRAALEREGYRVVLACDGLDAILVFREETPDLVILDVSMPRVGGLEALEWISSLAPQVPVILFTAHSEDCLRDRRASLAKACISKGEDLSELKRAIADELSSVGSEDRLSPIPSGLPPPSRNASR